MEKSNCIAKHIIYNTIIYRNCYFIIVFHYRNITLILDWDTIIYITQVEINSSLMYRLIWTMLLEVMLYCYLCVYVCGYIMRDSWYVTVQNSANNANGHIRRICTRLIFVSIGVNSLAIFLTKRTRITSNRA